MKVSIKLFIVITFILPFLSCQEQKNEIEISGIVKYKDTGEPVPNVQLSQANRCIIDEEYNRIMKLSLHNCTPSSDPIEVDENGCFYSNNWIIENGYLFLNNDTIVSVNSYEGYKEDYTDIELLVSKKNIVELNLINEYQKYDTICFTYYIEGSANGTIIQTTKKVRVVNDTVLYLKGVQGEYASIIVYDQLPNGESDFYFSIENVDTFCYIHKF